MTLIPNNFMNRMKQNHIVTFSCRGEVFDTLSRKQIPKYEIFQKFSSNIKFSTSCKSTKNS